MKERTCAEYVTVACIRKVRGRRGEVAAEILTDFPERFRAGAELLLSGESSLQTVYLESIWFQKGLAILKFRGFEDISAAETLVGRQVRIPLSERIPLPRGMVYLSDLIGCAVIEQDETERKALGLVESVEETGAVPLLQVHTAEGELLIPFAQDICTVVDVERKEIRVRLPEGLKELNRKDAAT